MMIRNKNYGLPRRDIFIINKSYAIEKETIAISKKEIE
ncbi:hypothetical protein FM120_03500 [Sphingobacterium faecium PCAi_F2.5]|nr:hypothetical protein FM120_03500 [Sphingobacterium faecium PCAi_F2.5]